MSRSKRPPYFDQAKGVVYDTSNGEFEGFLAKQSVWLRDWRRRFFVLKGSPLFFARTRHEAPHGMIDLSRCIAVRSADSKSHKRHSFEISTPETTYLLYAFDERDKNDWILFIGRAIIRSSGTCVSGGRSTHTVGNGGHTAQTGHTCDSDSDDYSNSKNDPYFND